MNMKKIFFIITYILAVFLFVKPTLAAKTADTCEYIKGGNIMDKFGDVIGLGYNSWGYNYQAHMFNGMYCDAYGDAGWCQQFKDIRLMMSWNDAWLSNKDCGTQSSDQGAYSSTTRPDGTLDRHYPVEAYIGSGAWLTNHASGTYTSAVQYNWDVSGDWVITVNSGTYPHDYTFNMTSLPDGTFTGLGGYPAGADPYTYDEIVINGQITGNSIVFTAVYYVGGNPTGYSWTATGTIDNSGNMSGTGTSGVYEWHNTSGTAIRVYKSCTVSDFVKIVAVPSTAVKDGTVSGYYNEGMWYTDETKTTEIGPVIWGSFAVIQEQASDPCGEYGVINFFSPFKQGLGNWVD